MTSQSPGAPATNSFANMDPVAIQQAQWLPPTSSDAAAAAAAGGMLPNTGLPPGAHPNPHQLAAVQAAMLQQQMIPPHGQQQPPTLNMMLQGMQAQQQAVGLQAALQHQNSQQHQQQQQQQFMLMQQQGGGGAGGNGANSRDATNPSPNSAMHPAAMQQMLQQQQQPPPSQTPPGEAAAIAAAAAAAAAQQQQSNLFLGGPRLDKPLEEFQLKQQQEMFGALAQQQATDAAVFASATPQERTVAAQMAAIAQIAAQQQQQQQQHQQHQHQQHQHQQHQMQQQYSQQQHFMGPPPGTGMHQTPMPPRPRPEGGLEGEHQDGGSSYHRPTKNNSDHLVIDSWTDEDNEKAQATQQHMGLMPPNNPSSTSSYDKSPRDELKVGSFNANNTTGTASGWGAPPPAVAGSWGEASGSAQPSRISGGWQPQQQPQQPPPQQPPPQQPPPPPQQSSFRGRGGYEPRGGGGERGGGWGGQRGGHSADSDMGHFQAPTSYTARGGGYSAPPRGGRGGGMRGYGRGGRGGYSGDRVVEKADGKKSAIAETIAMMNKMKMEDKERKEEGEKRRLARLQREAGIETGEGAPPPPPPQQSDPNPEQEIDPEAYKEESRRQRQLQRGGRGEGRERRGFGRGGFGGMGMDAMPGAFNHQFQAGGGMGPANLMQQQVPPMFMQAPPAPGMGIPPFPGLEGFLPPGAPPAMAAQVAAALAAQAGGGGGNGFPGGGYGGPGAAAAAAAAAQQAGYFAQMPPGAFVPPGRGFPRGGRGGFPPIMAPPRGAGPGGGMRGGMPMGMMGAGPRGMRGVGGGGGGRGRGGYSNNREFKPGRLEFEPDGEDASDSQAGNKKHEENAAEQNGTADSGEAVPPAPDASNGDGGGGGVGEAKGGEGGAADDGSASDTASKNLHSGQGTTTSVSRGQLALPAQEFSPSSGNGKRQRGAQNVRSAAKSQNRDIGLRERLVQQLVEGSLECLICLENVRPKHAVFDCQECYQVFHIHCIKKWSKTAKNEGESNWVCPGCRKPSPTTLRAMQYRCFCRKIREPEWNRRDTPHSCGDVCGKQLSKTKNKRSDGAGNDNTARCVHKCVELCHPGPCPPCNANIKITCPCGQSQTFGRCGTEITCDAECGKRLNCDVHKCARKCHKDPCPPCEVEVKQECHCGKEDRVAACIAPDVPLLYSCGAPCGRRLDCDNHSCDAICHAGDCAPCEMTPERIASCPCGKSDLEKIYAEKASLQRRESCLQPVPTCGGVCNRKLDNCGHPCESQCHEGPCPACPLTSEVRCRCGFMDREIPCAEMKTRSDDARCEKRCSRKRSCGRHKCNEMCCIEVDHVCPLVCGRPLGCGSHRCEDPCHRGNCHSCPHVSFDELSCHCGERTLFPPVACGTKPPECANRCARSHECDHAVMHNCHSEERCPPCAALTERRCYGGHELRKSVPCHIEGLSCGRPCKKELPCIRHNCIKACHEGDCLTDSANAEESCGQPCTEIRQSCDHPCSAPCHDPPCPAAAPCKERVKVTCECGHLSATRTCSDQASDFQRLQMSHLMQQLNSSGGSSVDLNSAMKMSNGGGKTGKLECNEECSQLDRNRRLALALQIENPDQAQKLSAPTYSNFMMEFAKKDLAFASKIHNKLSELVKLAKESKQRSRAHSFDVMNREKRQFVHECCSHFGVDSESYDAEPKRNVVAVAYRDRIWMPSHSIVDVVTKQRRAPGPPPPAASAVNGKTAPSMSQLKPRGITAAWNGASNSIAAVTGGRVVSNGESATKNEDTADKEIDYFDD